MKLKKGVWCYADFKLVQIQGDAGIGVETLEPTSFGAIRSGTTRSNCFPITMHSAKTSALLQYVSDRLHDVNRKRKQYIFNFPDIHRKLVSMWVELCKMNPDSEEFGSAIKELEKFQNVILYHMRSRKRAREQRIVFGINLYNHNIKTKTK